LTPCGEIREELRAEIDRPELLGVLENLFIYAGEPGHEIVLVFDARFRDRSLYEQDEIPMAEDAWLGPATWLHLGSLRSVGTPVYPEGLLDLLRPLARPTVATRGKGRTSTAPRQPLARKETQ